MRLRDGRTIWKTWLAAAVILLTAAGCSRIQGVFDGGAAEAPAPQAPQPVSGRMDSLWNSDLPGDTLFLAPRADTPPGNLLPERPALRRGSASAEVARPEAVWGWRVQLASSSDRGVLEELVSRVEREFGSTAYLDSHGGIYTLRIGAFASMEQAARERERAVSYGYKQAWIVQTPIPPHQIQREE